MSARYGLIRDRGISTMNMEIKVTFGARIRKPISNKGARIAIERVGRVGGVGDERQRVEWVGGVFERATGTKALVVEKERAAPAGINRAGSRAMAAGALDLGTLGHLVEHQAMVMAKMLELHLSLSLFVECLVYA